MDKTIVKGFNVLEHLATSQRPCGITSISKALDLKKSNVHRILSTLISLGYVSQNPDTSEYSATLRVWEIGEQVHSRIDVRREASPFLRELSDFTAETVELVILSGLEVVFIETFESTQAVRAHARYGSRAPTWCTAAGKILLAYQDKSVLNSIPKKLKRFTDATITDRDTLLKELAKIRETGFGINRGEFDETVWSMGVPVWSIAPEPVAAVTFSAPADRFKERDIDADARKFTQVVKGLSRRLGYLGN